MPHSKLLSKNTAHGEPAFPWKLHSVLEASVAGGFDDIVSWEADNAFKVHDPIQFENTVMKRFFNHTQYKSFQRQLNIYGFTRIKTGGRATGAYEHPCFVRGNPDACRYMVRIKIKNKGLRSKMSTIKNASPRMIRGQLLDRLMKYNDEVLPCLFPNKQSMLFNDAVPGPSTIFSNNNNNNDVMEPTPIACGSFQETDTTRTTISPETILYSRQSCPFHFLQEDHHQPCDNDELDLDTIFDDDDIHIFHRNRNTNIDNCYNNCIKPIHPREEFSMLGHSKLYDVMRNSIVTS